MTFYVGFLAGDFLLMVMLFRFGVALACALVFPAWPMFYRDPFEWLPPMEPVEGSKTPEQVRKTLGSLWGVF